MSNLKNRLEIFDSSADTRSFIYQQISELEEFLSDNTQVMVTAKNPIGLLIQLETEGVHIPRSKLKNMHRISIKLTDEDAFIEAEGLHENLFEAILLAKEKLIFQLREIQEKVMSSSDRLAHINSLLASGNIH